MPTDPSDLGSSSIEPLLTNDSMLHQSQSGWGPASPRLGWSTLVTVFIVEVLGMFLLFLLLSILGSLVG